MKVKQRERQVRTAEGVPPPRISPLKPTPVYDTYWRFAAERQRVFFRRLRGAEPPWTDDPVLRSFKFTNAYRASDRVSQALIRLIYRCDLPDDLEEQFFRTVLFKVFNRIGTWEALEAALGHVTYEDYSFRRYDDVLSGLMERGQPIYSAAYIMPPAAGLGHRRKHQNHLALIERMMRDELPQRLASAASMQAAFDHLRAYPTIGDFLAYQYVTDLNYSHVTNFSEADFVVPGPGAINGIRKCFSDRGGLNDSEIIRFMADRQEVEFKRLGLRFETLWGRRLQLIDCQNLFCEVDKYARVEHPEFNGRSGRTRIKQRFRASPDPIEYWYPPKWEINSAIAAEGNGQGRQREAIGLGRQAMDLNQYQKLVTKRDQNPTTDSKSVMIPLLGLAGETGELLSEYKKFLRDGESHVLFRDRFSEELGDLLWYLANAATKFGLDLQEVANRNLEKCRDRWERSTGPKVLDDDYPEEERLPRRFEIDFNTVHDKDGKPQMRAYYKGEQLGARLTDNAYEGDGYRFHDVFHFTFAAVLGWSPLTRYLLKCKRRSSKDIDEVEDGGRANVIEEGISALCFSYAKDYNWLEGKASVSSELLRTIKNMTAHLEVRECSTGDWEQAIVKGFELWRQMKRQGGGTVVADLDKRSIAFKEP